MDVVGQKEFFGEYPRGVSLVNTAKDVGVVCLGYGSLQRFGRAARRFETASGTVCERDFDVVFALALAAKPRVAVEIGVCAGMTAAILLHGIAEIERYIGVDVPPSVSGCTWRNRGGEAAGNLVRDDRFELMVSPDGSRNPALRDVKADFVYIDGDHSYESVRHDTLLADEIIRPGGVVVWHDYHPFYQDTVCKWLEEWGKAKRVKGTSVCFQWCRE